MWPERLDVPQWLHQWLAAPLLPFAQQPHCKMSLTTLTTAPTEGDFTPLSEHHEQTPGSFFAGKPVLHLQAPASKLQVSKEDLEANEAVKALVATTDDAAVDAEGLVEIQDIDVWVTSRYAKHSIHSSYNFRFAHT
jgi:nucleotide-sensitive chloride channel 1A